MLTPAQVPDFHAALLIFVLLKFIARLLDLRVAAARDGEGK